MSGEYQTRESGGTVRNAAAVATLIFVSLRVVPYLRETVVPHLTVLAVQYPTVIATLLWLPGLSGLMLTLQAARRR